jgi:iron complex outermembrane receptor protein
MRQSIQVILCLALFCSGIRAQDCAYTLTGSISDADTRSPLDRAVIRIRETGAVSLSDEEGHYHFYGLCRGIYNVVISHVNCDSVVLRVRITDNLVRNVVLPHRVNQLQEVLVRTTREQHPVTVREELDRREISEARVQRLGEMLSRISGVTVLQTGNSVFKPVIHGLHSQRVLILNNGVRQEGQQWGAEHAPEMDPFISDRFIVLKGAGALKYGSDAIGGAILAEPKALPSDQRFHANLHTGFSTNNRQYVVHAMAEQHLVHAPAWSWRAHVTHRRSGNVRTPDYWQHNTGAGELNFSAAVGYRKPTFRSDIFFSAFQTRIGIFSGSHIGNLTDLQQTILSPRPLLNIDAFTYDIDRPYQQVGHYLLRSRSVWNLKQGNRLNLQIAQQFNLRQEYDRAMITDRPELDLSLNTTTADLGWEQDPGRPRHVQAGIGMMRQENAWSGSRFFIPNYVLLNPYAYMLRRSVKGPWTAEAGFRFDHRNLTSYRNRSGAMSSQELAFSNISGSGGITRKMGSDLKLSGNAAWAWRAPHVNELYVNGLHHGTATFEIGDSLLKQERALNLSVQLTFDDDSLWDADITLYSNLIRDFINLVPVTPATLTLRGAYPTFRFKQTDARLSGADYRISRVLTERWSAMVKGSFLFARDLGKDDWLSQMPPHRVEGQITWKIPGARFRDTYLSPSVQHVFRQRLVPDPNNDYLAPPPAYTLVHLNFGTSFRISGWESSLNMGVHNLLNVRYRDYMNRFRYFTDEMGRNFTLQWRVGL